MKSFLRFWRWHNAQQAPGLPTTCLLRFSLVGSNSQIGANLHQFPRLVLPCPLGDPFPTSPTTPGSTGHQSIILDHLLMFGLAGDSPPSPPSPPSKYKCCILNSKLFIWICCQEEKRVTAIFRVDLKCVVDRYIWLCGRCRGWLCGELETKYPKYVPHPLNWRHKMGYLLHYDLKEDLMICIDEMKWLMVILCEEVQGFPWISCLELNQHHLKINNWYP